MKTLGLIGGIAPESTVAYYRALIRFHREARPGSGDPPLIISSIDRRRMADLAHPDRRPVVDFLAAEVERLRRAGADVALFAASSPHIVLDEVQRQVPIPLVDISPPTSLAAEARGLRRVGLLGTRITMKGGFYQSACAGRGIAVVVPMAAEQAQIQLVYQRDLLTGNYSREALDVMGTVVARMQREDGIDGVILGGGEIALLFDGFDAGLPAIDTLQVHARAALSALLA